MLKKSFRFSIKEREQLEKAFKKSEMTEKTKEQIDDCLTLCIVDDMRECEPNNPNTISKWTFRVIMDIYNVKTVELVRYAREHEVYLDEACIRDMRARTKDRKPDCLSSEQLIEFCRDNRDARLGYEKIDEKQLIGADRFMRKNGIYDFKDDMALDIYRLLTDEQISLLHKHKGVFLDFSPVMWETIRQVENATEAQRKKIEDNFWHVSKIYKDLNVRCEKAKQKFKKKGLKFKKVSPKIKKKKLDDESMKVDVIGLFKKIKWENTITSDKNRENKIYDIVINIKDSEDVFYQRLEIYAKLTKEDWELVKMIFLNEALTKKKNNFSTYTNRKLEECFAD